MFPSARQSQNLSSSGNPPMAQYPAMYYGGSKTSMMSGPSSHTAKGDNGRGLLAESYERMRNEMRALQGEFSNAPSSAFPPPPPAGKDSISMLLDAKEVSLSSLLEAAMDPSVGSSKRKEDPLMKQAILDKCEEKIAQLYRHRISGMGTFFPRIQMKGFKDEGNSFLSFHHPRIEFNMTPLPPVWTCPDVNLESVVKTTEHKEDREMSPESKPIETISNNPRRKKDTSFHNEIAYNDVAVTGYVPRAVQLPHMQHPPPIVSGGIDVTMPPPDIYASTAFEKWVEMERERQHKEKEREWELLEEKHRQRDKEKEEERRRKKKKRRRSSRSHSRSRSQSRDRELSSRRERRKRYRSRSNSLSLSPPRRPVSRERRHFRHHSPNDFRSHHRSRTASPHRPAHRLFSPNSIGASADVQSYIPNMDPPFTWTSGLSDVPQSRQGSSEPYKYSYNNKDASSYPDYCPPYGGSPGQYGQMMRPPFHPMGGPEGYPMYRPGGPMMNRPTPPFMTGLRGPPMIGPRGPGPRGPPLGTLPSRLKLVPFKNNSVNPDLIYPKISLNTSPTKPTSSFSTKPTSRDNSPKDSADDVVFIDSPEKILDVIIIDDEKDSKSSHDLTVHPPGVSPERVLPEKESDFSRSMRSSFKRILAPLQKIMDSVRAIQRDSFDYKTLIKGLELGSCEFDGPYTLLDGILCRVIMDNRVSRKRMLKVVLPSLSLPQVLKEIHKQFHDYSTGKIKLLFEDVFYMNARISSSMISSVFDTCKRCKSKKNETAKNPENSSSKKLKKTEKDRGASWPRKEDKPGVNETRDHEDLSKHSRDGHGRKGKELYSSKRADKRSTGDDKPIKPKEKGNQENDKQESKGGGDSVEKSKKPQTAEVVHKAPVETERSNDPIDSKNDTAAPEQPDRGVDGGNTNVHNSESKNELSPSKVNSVTEEVSKKSPLTQPNNHVAEIPTEESKPVDFKLRVRTVQMSLDDLRIHIVNLEKPEKKTTEPNLLLKAGMLCRRVVNEGGKTEVKIIVTPSSLRRMVQIVHTMAVIHAPAHKTLTVFNKHFTQIEGVQDAITQILNDCKVCK